MRVEGYVNLRNDSESPGDSAALEGSMENAEARQSSAAKRLHLGRRRELRRRRGRGAVAARADNDVVNEPMHCLRIKVSQIQRPNS